MGRKYRYEKKYASYLTPENFEEICPLLQSVLRRTKPTTVDLYEVFCAVLSLLRSGCQWRMLAEDFPKLRTVHSYFSKWVGVTPISWTLSK